MPSQFNIKSYEPDSVAALVSELGISQFLARILVARGITDAACAQAFLDPQLTRDWFDPYQVAGLEEVVERLHAAILGDRRIVVFGDFDLDGISATALMTRGLQALGAKFVRPFIPRRFDEGYAITPAALERLSAQGSFDVLVTVDCGIACRHEVADLCAAGVEVLITDHHEPGDLVPVGVPVCDPKLKSGSAESMLAGVGVALCVIQALGARLGKPHLWRSLTDLACLGTVADLMPLQGANRALVADGVARMNNSLRPGLAALLSHTTQADKPLSAHNLSFSLIPRLNAAGRMGDAQVALDLLLCDNSAQAHNIAEELEAINNDRRSHESQLAEAALEQAERLAPGAHVLVLAGEGWHEGVKGIVASRMVSKFGLPCFMFSIEGDEARGSARSVGQINLFEATKSCADLLVRYGGHEAAVGLTIKADKLEEFRARMESYMAKQDPASFKPRIDIDAVIDLADANIEHTQELSLLEPYGQKNPVPKFLAQNVALISGRAVGADKNHLSGVLTDGRSKLSCIMFRCPGITSLLNCKSVLNAAFELELEHWAGKDQVKAHVAALSPAKPCVALDDAQNLEARQFIDGLFTTEFEAQVSTAGLASASVIASGLTSAMASSVSPGQVSSLSPAKQNFSDMSFSRRSTARQSIADMRSLDALEVLAQDILGTGSKLYPAQKESLQALSENQSCLSIMPTSRGKSLIFYVRAAYEALVHGKQSLFVFPLRALIADQLFCAQEALGRFGLQVCVVTGQSSPKERKSVFEQLASKKCDVVLTTPEFALFHKEDFVRNGDVGFIAVDEAHHVALSTQTHRSAYTQLDELVKALGKPLIFAATATSPLSCTERLVSLLRIKRVVVDRSVRENLQVIDHRNNRQRDALLASLVSQGKKTLIYVSSREACVQLARSLRKRLGHMAHYIGFYHGGLSREDRSRIEQCFRSGDILVLVCTSAFGEGINIPDIDQVVLYHCPLSMVDFNQICGRAGRAGQKSWIHLLDTRQDAQLNRSILQKAHPNYDDMAQIYRGLRRLSQASEEECLFIGEAQLLEELSLGFASTAIGPEALYCALFVFAELGLLSYEVHYSAPLPNYEIRLESDPGKVSLEDSIRYLEGLEEQSFFEQFYNWYNTANLSDIQERISQALAPCDEDLHKEGL